jgi:hypothetical protein
MKVNRVVGAMALTVAVLNVGAFAQVQQIPQGRVLDANPQVGSGGSNQPIPGYVPINGNAIIEGNVGGLARFHGTVGTSSPYTFQQQLPSASLQGFARTSSAGIPTGPAGSPPPVYYLPSQVVSGASGQLYPTQVGSGFDVRVTPGPSIQPGFGSTASSAIGGQDRFVDRTQPTESMETGAPGNLLSSPLFIRQQFEPGPNEPGGRPASANYQRPGVQTKSEKENPNAEDVNPQDTTEKPEDTTASKRLRTDARVTGERVDATANRQRPGLGTETGTEGAPNPMDIRNTGRMQNVGQQAMVNDTYRTLMDDLKKAREEAKRTEATTGETTAKTDETRGQTQGPGLARTPGTTDFGMRQRSGRMMNPLLEEPQETLRAGQKVEPLKTLAKTPKGYPTTPFDTQMQQAEQLLKDGKYMEAVDQYQQALTLQPTNALALVGRAHAELAAGMYQSAAIDLKAVFTQKPDMVSVRYTLNDFIPSKRVDNLMTDLLELTTRPRTGNMASFLYCYLSYNTDHPTELQQELDRWGIRPAHDEWQAICAKAWGK